MPTHPTATSRRESRRGATTSTPGQLVRADGEPRLVFRRRGSVGGPSLVCLHGLSANASSWDPVVDRFADRWSTFTIDFRGHGESDHTPGRYHIADYVDDAERLLTNVGERSVVVGHSLGAIVAVELARRDHPLVAAIFLEDPPLYTLDAEGLAVTGIARTFEVLYEHVVRLQQRQAPVVDYRNLLAAAPHPAGDTMGDHLHADALWSRSHALAKVDPGCISALLDGSGTVDYRPDPRWSCPAMIVRADPSLGAVFLPEHEEFVRSGSPAVEIVEMRQAGHNVRGDCATRDAYLDTLDRFLGHIVSDLRPDRLHDAPCHTGLHGDRPVRRSRGIAS